MNYFAHGIPFLDEPYFVAGTAVPDWLTVADRKLRIRRKQIEPFMEDTDVRVAAVARGMMQHLRDDARFHASRAFAELSLALTVAVRDALQCERGFRPSFLGHLLVELLLDASLVAEDAKRLETYYAVLESVDAAAVEAAVNRMAPRPTDRLAPMILKFRRERILGDYLDDARLMVRLDQVMRRVKLPQLPEDFRHILPDARRQVDGRKVELLDGIPA